MTKFSNADADDDDDDDRAMAIPRHLELEAVTRT